MRQPFHALKTLAVRLLNVALATSAIAADEDFKPIFDGRSPAGWKAADMSFWSVEDGAITAKITPGHPLKENLYLALQLHTGPPTTAQFKDIQLKILKPASAVKAAAYLDLCQVRTSASQMDISPGTELLGRVCAMLGGF